MPVLSTMRFAATAVCVLGVGGCGTPAKVDAGQVRLDYQSSVADYRKCLAAFPNNPKACEAKRLIVETNERRIQPDDRQAVSDPTTALKSTDKAAVAYIQPPATLALRHPPFYLRSERQRGYCVCCEYRPRGIGHVAKDRPFHYGPILHPD
jgi:hypothetical protein